jgi:hypothetical protein
MMDAFEAVVSMLLRREGYWTWPSYKVNLTKEEKVAIGRASSPRWEIDLIAYKGNGNEILAVECKSFLDSPGVQFSDGSLQPNNVYKMFCEPSLRGVVLSHLGKQLEQSGSCASNPNVRLALATGKIANSTDRDAMKNYFEQNEWMLFDDYWIQTKLHNLRESQYEDDIAYVAAKIALRIKKK